MKLTDDKILLVGSVKHGCFWADKPAIIQDICLAAKEFGYVVVPMAVAHMIDSLVEVSRDGCGVDGDDLQDRLRHAGIIEEYTAKEPCCQDCICAEVADFPQTCYRDSNEYREMMKAAEAAE